jgi:gamma-glutamyltranspeptidase/glutathione hydrolase
MNWRSRVRLVRLAAVFGVAAIIGVQIVGTYAANHEAAYEAEDGALASNAGIRGDSRAFGGQAVTFGYGGGLRLLNQQWPDRRVWAHTIMHGMPEFSDEGNGNIYGDVYPLDLVEGNYQATPRPTARVPRALQAGVTGMQVLQQEVDSSVWMTEDWMKWADPTWSDSDPNNNFMVAPCMQASEAKTIALIKDYAVKATGRPSAARIGGKLVIYTYGARGMAPEAWGRIRTAVQQAGINVYIIADLGVDASQHNFTVIPSMLTPYFQYVDASYIFEDSLHRIWDQLVPFLNSNNRQYAGGHMPGYDREYLPGQPQNCEPYCGFVDAVGTDLYRRLWDLQLAAGGLWQNVITWNDKLERTEIEASSNWNKTRADITAFYSAKLRRLPYPRPRAELYVTSPIHIKIGQSMRSEGMALNGSNEPVTVKTRLLDNNRQPVAGTQAEQVVMPGASGAAVTPDTAVNTMPAGRFFRTHAAIHAADGRLLQEVVSAPTVVYEASANPTPVLRRLYYSVPAYAVMPGAVNLSLSGSPVSSTSATATVTPPAGTQVRFSEVIQNTRSVGNGFTRSPYTVGIPMPPRTTAGGQLTTAAANGFYVGRVIDEQERVGYSDPVFVP